MKVTIDDNFLISIEDMDLQEVEAFISMVRGGGLEAMLLLQKAEKRKAKNESDD